MKFAPIDFSTEPVLELKPKSRFRLQGCPKSGELYVGRFLGHPRVIIATAVYANVCCLSLKKRLDLNSRSGVGVCTLLPARRELWAGV